MLPRVEASATFAPLAERCYDALIAVDAVPCLRSTRGGLCAAADLLFDDDSPAETSGATPKSRDLKDRCVAALSAVSRERCVQIFLLLFFFSLFFFFLSPPRRLSVSVAAMIRVSGELSERETLLRFRGEGARSALLSREKGVFSYISYERE